MIKLGFYEGKRSLIKLCIERDNMVNDNTSIFDDIMINWQQMYTFHLSATSKHMTDGDLLSMLLFIELSEAMTSFTL